MENMYVRQYAKGKPNQFTLGSVIGPNVHTHSPLTLTSFLPQIYTFHTCMFISIQGQMKISSLQTYPYVHFNTLS